jgi:hypothetical protein
MKNILIISILCLAMHATAHQVQAQSGSTYALWQGHAGWSAPRMGTLPGHVAPAAGNLTFGSSGMGRIGERWLVGGSGFGSVARSAGTDAQVNADYGMGFLDFGYTLRSRKRQLHYAFAGVGGGGATLRYDNPTENPLRLADNLSVAPNDRTKISTGGLAWQAGLSFNRLCFDPATQSGGLKLGLDFGVYHFARMSRWQAVANDVTLGGLNRPTLYGAYVRFTVGGAW